MIEIDLNSPPSQLWPEVFREGHHAFRVHVDRLRHSSMEETVSGYTPWIMPGLTPVEMHEFHVLGKKEALAFTAELVKRSTERIVELERLVKSTPGHEAWEADLSRDSLRELGRWAEKHVPVRSPGPGEGWKRFASVPPGVDISKLPPLRARWLIADVGQSMVADIGIYMAEVLRITHPAWKWTTCRGRVGKSILVDQNQPIVAWHGRIQPGFSPLECGRNVILRIIERSATPDMLWSHIGGKIRLIPLLRKRHGDAE